MIDHFDEDVLRDEVSDEALVAAAFVALGGLPTLPQTYCFACPSVPLDAIRGKVCQTQQSRRDETPTASPFPHTMLWDVIVWGPQKHNPRACALNRRLCCAGEIAVQPSELPTSILG